ncbi:MAG TPA: hypothetical protein VGO93_17140 [Candidatus Xenobia bacterium]|jgi:hypothetical protein
MQRRAALLLLLGSLLSLGIPPAHAQRDDDERRVWGQIVYVNQQGQPPTLTINSNQWGQQTYTVDRDRLGEDARHRWWRMHPGEDVALTVHYSHRWRSWRVTDIDLPEHHDHDWHDQNQNQYHNQNWQH